VTKKPLPKFVSHLPPDAREALVAASKLRVPNERKREVQAAIERTQRKYPHLFKTTT